MFLKKFVPIGSTVFFGYKPTNRQINKQTNLQTDRPTNRQSNKQTSQQTDKPTDRQTYKQTGQQTDNPTIDLFVDMYVQIDN